MRACARTINAGCEDAHVAPSALGGSVSSDQGASAVVGRTSHGHSERYRLLDRVDCRLAAKGMGLVRRQQHRQRARRAAAAANIESVTGLGTFSRQVGGRKVGLRNGKSQA